MNTCQITPVTYQIAAGTFDSNAITILSESPSLPEIRERQEFIIVHKDIFQFYDWITIKVVKDGEDVDEYPTIELKARTWMPKHHVLNDEVDMELVIRCVNGKGRLVKSVCHNTQTALAVAYNWIHLLGWNVTISNEIGTDYFDSDFEEIIIEDDGTYKAVYLMGSR